MIEGTGLSATFGRDEARKIHEENVNKLTTMSEEEIMAEQKKLLQSLGNFLHLCILSLCLNKNTFSIYLEFYGCKIDIFFSIKVVIKFFLFLLEL